MLAMRFVTVSLAVLLAGCGARAPGVVTSPAPQGDASGPSGGAGDPGAAPQRMAGDSLSAAQVSHSELVTRAAAIFNGVPAALDSNAAAGADARATWDIDVRSYETHEMVAQYIGIFTGRARDYMQRSMSRGTRYDAILRRKFREAGLPEDMTYLALIESSYMPHAYSRAAAVGMWQFMAPTARAVGMRVDWWVDERRDPMRATKGAIDFLTDLHDAYGSWYLAAAAYNGGPGRVSRGLKRFSEEINGSEGEDRFFALAEQRFLPSETKAYVPKLIAAAMVAKEPARYGLRVDTMPVYAYDSVEVPAGTALAAVAKAAGVSLADVIELNPHYLRGVTPPDDSADVRIPVGAAPAFAAAFSALPAAEREGWREERIDTPRSAQAIADEAGIPVKALRWVNPKLTLDRRGRVREGTLLRIPTLLAIAGARDVPDPSIARYSSASGSLVAKRVRVRRGESLASVARRSGVSVARLKALNGIRGSRVRAGQVLVVRRPSRGAVTAARRAASARSRASSGERCTSRVIRVKGKRRTVTSCTARSRRITPSSAAASRNSRSSATAAKKGRSRASVGPSKQRASSASSRTRRKGSR